MKVIWKFKFELFNPVALQATINKQSKPVLVSVQDRAYFIWFEVDNLEEKIERYFHIYPTGKEYNPTRFNHVISFLDKGLVWHILEEVK